MPRDNTHNRRQKVELLRHLARSTWNLGDQAMAKDYLAEYADLLEAQEMTKESKDEAR